jgi:hypothetical protein
MEQERERGVNHRVHPVLDADVPHHLRTDDFGCWRTRMGSSAMSEASRRRDKQNVAARKLQKLLLKNLERGFAELRAQQRERERTNPKLRKRLERILLKRVAL